MSINDEEVSKTDISNPLTVAQRQTVCFQSFVIKVHPYQA